jgi:fructuronate reductase
VGSDGSVKLRQRIPAPALQLLDDGRMPQLLALTSAAYLSCIAPLPGFDPGAQAHAMEDPARGLLAGLAAESRSGSDLARMVLGGHHLLGEELAERDDFILRTGEFIDIIHAAGPLAALAEANTALSPAPTLQTIRSTP